MPKRSCPFAYNEYAIKIGHEFFNIQYMKMEITKGKTLDASI